MSESNMCGDLYSNNEGSSYSTCDLYLASFFISCGCRMTSHERDSKSRRVYFIFEKNPLIQELKVNYFSRQAKVEALNFADNIKSLKSLCHNLTNDGIRI
jgi:hypothetical protein